MQDDVGAHRSRRAPARPFGRARARPTYGDDTSASLVTFAGRLAWRVQLPRRRRRGLRRDRRRAHRRRPAAGEHGQVRGARARSGSASRATGRAARAAPVDLEAPGWLRAGATTLNGPNAHAYSDLDDNDAAAASEEVTRAGGGFSFPFVAGRRQRLRRRAPVLVERRPPTGRSTARRTPSRPSTSPTASTTTSPRRRSASRPRRARSRAPTTLQLNTLDGASTGPDGDHVNNANMFTPPDGSHAADADVPVALAVPQHLQRQRRGDPLPRVHARALEPARAPTPTATAR